MRIVNLYCLTCKKFRDMSNAEGGNFKCPVCGATRIYKSKKGEFNEQKVNI